MLTSSEEPKMALSVLEPVESSLANDGSVKRLYRIRLRSGAWHVVEVIVGGVGGIFASLSDAVAFARNEARAFGDARVVIDFGSAA
jgi:hypothetical protein